MTRMKFVQGKQEDREEFSGRLAGFPHPDGRYNGHTTIENGQTWHYIEAEDGNDCETQDFPLEVIHLHYPSHLELQVHNTSGALILAVVELPKYWWKAEASHVHHLPQ